VNVKNGQGRSAKGKRPESRGFKSVGERKEVSGIWNLAGLPGSAGTGPGFCRVSVRG
jgi:hypothetical protein